jgi:hypothetical protein
MAIGPVQLMVLGSATPAYLATSSPGWSGCAKSDLERVIGEEGAVAGCGG